MQDNVPPHTICDAGGGQDVLLQSTLSVDSKAKGILFDQADVVNNHRLDDLSARVQILSGDFFVSVPEAEFRRLFGEAELKLTQAIPTKSPMSLIDGEAVL